jgi:hypothetical protein
VGCSRSVGVVLIPEKTDHSEVWAIRLLRVNVISVSTHLRTLPDLVFSSTIFQLSAAILIFKKVNFTQLA